MDGCYFFRILSRFPLQGHPVITAKMPEKFFHFFQKSCWQISKAVLRCSSVERELSAQENRDGRVVELVDSLDSGSSVHCGRAGSSPASPTRETVERLSLFLLVHPGQNRGINLLWMKKEYFLYFSPLLWSLHLFASIAIYFAGAPSVWTLSRKVWHFPIPDYPCEICKGILQ